MPLIQYCIFAISRGRILLIPPAREVLAPVTMPVVPRAFSFQGFATLQGDMFDQVRKVSAAQAAGLPA